MPLMRSPSLSRLGEMVAVSVIGGSLTAVWTPWQLAILVGWLLAAAVYLVRTWLVIATSDGQRTRLLATIEDDSRPVSGLLVVVAATASLGGAALALREASATSGGSAVALAGGAVLTVILSWGVVHTDFALRYAHAYYSAPVGGIDFHGVESPDFHDFAYLAFTIGMTYQVSDTGLLAPRFRRVVLAHAMVSYLFGAVIIAAVISLVAGIVN